MESASAAAAKAAADLETAGKSHQARIAELQACFQAKIRDLRRAHDDQLTAAQAAAGDHAGHRHAQVRFHFFAWCVCVQRDGHVSITSLSR